eukprot:CAMPEP_0183777648 /NCGR_PEP_ID=MMETSP0739-20130205/49518_1 /TAXON_ID=385413 /ORGANISM="Thalassiosira miniscula, Strain CCMP1093" /LENGTH=256 /DNA_ID=CAMNT_0026019827 /DNA_START=822 /DNA_END=1592 /DNA_ORIENTATION=-
MALVGLGACTYTICSTHGFLPHAALGYSPGSPLLDNVKCDLSRMAANIASGVGFIGAGAIHKSKQHGNGTEAQNVVAGLTTAAAIWVSAAVGIASAVGLYFVGAVATFATVAILKYARVSREEEPGFLWEPRPLDIVDHNDNKRVTSDKPSSTKHHDAISGLFGKHDITGQQGPRETSYADNTMIESYYKDLSPIIIKEVIDPQLEKYIQTRLAIGKDGGHKLHDNEEHVESQVLIEEEQEVISYNVTESNTDTSL